MVDTVLSVDNLSIEAATADGPKTIVDDVSLCLSVGETLCIAGESGSGKSITSLAIMGLLPPSTKVTRGQVNVNNRNLLDLTDREMQGVRGGDIAMIFQEPMTSLNPVMMIGKQLTETISTHQGIYGAESRQKALQALDAVRMSESARRLKQYPHELSGGMRQRVMIAMALSCNPKVLIADEPTTALDVTVQAQILSLMNDLKRDFDTSVILITHDMGVVAEMADRVIVMNGGQIIETGNVFQVFDHPQKSYTRKLLAAVPVLGSLKNTNQKQKDLFENIKHHEPVVKIEDLTVRFDITGGFFHRPVNRVHAVEKVSLDIFKNETLALVGESGCGKSTIGKSLANLIPWTGSIKISGTEISGLSSKSMQPIRRNIQLVFQDPYAALDKRMTVGDLVGEPLLIHNLAKGRELDGKVAELFRRVGLTPDMMSRHPHEFSGGQRQRICIARALCLEPKVIIADESVSALDVSVQAQVLDLLQELQQELELSFLFISHDMAVVEQISHRVAVMFLGQIVEIGSCNQVFGNPQHPYTKKLLGSVPIPDPHKRRTDRKLPTGEVPSPVQSLDFVPEILQFTKVEDGHYFVNEIDFF